MKGARIMFENRFRRYGVVFALPLICLIMSAVLMLPCEAHPGEVPPELARLLESLKSPDYMEAWAVVDNLAEHVDQKDVIVPALIEAFGSEWEHCTGDIRQSIAYSLASLGATEAVFTMIEMVGEGADISHGCAECGCCFNPFTPGDYVEMRNPDFFCENGVIDAINRLADFSHSKVMADLVTRGIWRPQFIVTLGKVGLTRYAHFIAKYIGDDRDDVRTAVAVAMGLIDNEEVTIPALARYIADGEENLFVRWNASNSLARVWEKGKNSGIRERMAGLLENPGPNTAVMAARTLALAGDERGRVSLRRRAGEGDLEALIALGETKDSGAKGLLIEKLSDDDLRVRAYAMFALGRIGDGAVVPLMEKSVKEAEKKAATEKKAAGKVKNELLDLTYGGGSVYFLMEAFQEATRTIEKKMRGSGLEN